MWVRNRQFVFTGSTNIIETIKNTDELLNMKGILLENKQTGVIISSSQQFDYALLPCPSFSPAWNSAGRYNQVNTHQADDLPLQTDDQPPKTDYQALQPDDHALQPEDQTLQPDHQEYQENQPDMSPVEHIVEHPPGARGDGYHPGEQIKLKFNE